MHPERVELIADKLRREASNEAPASVLQHLDSARAKLDELRRVRRGLAATLAETAEERDAAVAALEKLQASQGEEARAVYKVQQIVIDELRRELDLAVGALEEVGSMLEVGRFSPNVFQRATDKIKDALASLAGPPADDGEVSS